MDSSFVQFVIDHENDDVSKLVLSASKYPSVDIKKAVRIIEARKKIRTKLPQWCACPNLDYPNSLSLEQCSSQATAMYKQRFVPGPESVIADITGGLGVDCWYLSRVAKTTYYYEKSAELCEAARDNFAQLMGGWLAPVVTQSDHIDDSRHYDLIYADPARRGSLDRRIFNIEDCQPNILSIKDKLLSLTSRLLIKISPMADVSQVMQLFPEATEIHIVSVGNECKEVLVFIDREAQSSDVSIVCADINAKGETLFEFAPAEEADAQAIQAESIGKYIYQPCRAILKAGAFRLVSRRFALAKLAPSSHLYTSDALVKNFPGRVFKVEDALDWNKQTIKELQGRFRSAELLAVNFPLDTNALRRRLGLGDGADAHIVATTLGPASNARKIVLILKNLL